MRCCAFGGLGFRVREGFGVGLDRAVLEAGEPDAFKCAAQGFTV